MDGLAFIPNSFLANLKSSFSYTLSLPPSLPPSPLPFFPLALSLISLPLPPPPSPHRTKDLTNKAHSKFMGGEGPEPTTEAAPAPVGGVRVGHSRMGGV